MFCPTPGELQEPCQFCYTRCTDHPHWYSGSDSYHTALLLTSCGGLSHVSSEYTVHLDTRLAQSRCVYFTLRQPCARCTNILARTCYEGHSSIHMWVAGASHDALLLTLCFAPHISVTSTAAILFLHHLNPALFIIIKDCCRTLIGF